MSAAPMPLSLAPDPLSILAELRAAGWSVAIHNDYRQGGEFNTFYLLTHPCGRWVKGEGASDEYALASCRRQIARYSMDNRPPQPYAVQTKENPLTETSTGNGALILCFDTYQQAEAFWKWADRAHRFSLQEGADASPSVSKKMAEIGVDLIWQFPGGTFAQTKALAAKAYLAMHAIRTEGETA